MAMLSHSARISTEKAYVVCDNALRARCRAGRAVDGLRVLPLLLIFSGSNDVVVVVAGAHSRLNKRHSRREKDIYLWTIFHNKYKIN